MHLPSKTYGFGLMTGFMFTMSVIALLAVTIPDELVAMATEISGNPTSSTVSFVVFGLVGLVPLLLELRRHDP